MNEKPWNRKATPREKKAVFILVAWVIVCFVISFFDLGLGVVLFVGGFFTWLLLARV